MKIKHVNLMILVIIFNSAFSQVYEPLVRENAHWVVADIDDWPVWHNVNIREYFTDGDTLMGDTLHKKVYMYQLEPSDEWGSPPYTRSGNPVLFGLLREDTIGRIVYGLRINVSPDYCFYTEDTLFDFSVAQYDSLEPCNAFMGPITFDTIYYDNAFGYYRKQFILTEASNYSGTRLYEGIGSVNGLFEGLGFAFKKDVFGSEMKCYTIGDISNWDILTQTGEEIALDINIYPNPLFGDKLNIQLPGYDSQNLTVQVSDIYGKAMYKCKFQSGTQKLDFGSLIQGVYIIKIVKDNKLLLIKKILKL